MHEEAKKNLMSVIGRNPAIVEDAVELVLREGSAEQLLKLLSQLPPWRPV